MEKIDSVTEILEFAIGREAESYEFYDNLAGRVEDTHVKDFIKEMANEELTHREKLELEVAKIGKVLPPILRNPDAEELANLQIDDYMIDAGRALSMDYIDVLLLGIKRERVSFRLYVNLATMIDDADLRETLLLLAEEEAGHKARLETIYEKLTEKRDSR